MAKCMVNILWNAFFTLDKLCSREVNNNNNKIKIHENVYKMHGYLNRFPHIQGPCLVASFSLLGIRMSSFVRLLEVGQGCQRKKNWTWEFRWVIDNYCCRTNYPQIQQFKNTSSTSLVVQWLRSHLPMQGTQIWSLVQGDSICRGATKPAGYSHWSPWAL